MKKWNAKIAEGDAYLFVTPEYNHSVPAVLKNAIDSVFATFAFRGKPAAYVGYSGGTRDRTPGARRDRGRDGPAAQQRDHPVTAGRFRASELLTRGRSQADDN